MQAFLVMFHSVWSVFVLIAFLGIVAWAFSGKRKQALEDAGRIPLDDDD